MDHYPPEQMAAQWARVRGRLQQEVGEVEYRTWLRQMTLVGLDGDEVTVHLPTRFLRDWVRAQFGDRLTALWQEQIPGVRRVEIGVGHGGGTGLAESIAPPPRPVAVSPGAVRPETRTPDARPPDARVEPRAVSDERGDGGLAPLDPRFGFDSFVVGKPNEFAHACARRVAAQPACAGFNPLFLYGGVGLGKTHLMHAIAWELTAPDRPGGPVSVAYMSAEKFMYRFISAIRSQSTIQFKDQLRSVDVLMIDDLQFLINKDATQDEFFHTFNALVEGGKQIVISADKSPSDLSGLEERVRTRLGSGMVADLHATTFELRVSILDAKVARAGVSVPARVLEFLSHKITSNIRELEGALNRVTAMASLSNQPVTKALAEQTLQDFFTTDVEIKPADIITQVAKYFYLTFDDIVGRSRTKKIALARQIAMYLVRELTSMSLNDIGLVFGGKDHTTVMHAYTRINDEMQEKQEIYNYVTELTLQLKQRSNDK
jgi:chromosomal replication initiator protein